MNALLTPSDAAHGTLAPCSPSKRKIALLALYSLLVMAGSLIPMDRDIRGLQFIIDLKPAFQNFLHVPVFAILAILCLQVLRAYEMGRRKTLVIVLLCSLTLGVVNELVQLAVPGRYPSLMDIVFNTVGIICGMWLYFFLDKRQPGLMRRLVCQ